MKRVGSGKSAAKSPAKPPGKRDGARSPKGRSSTPASVPAAADAAREAESCRNCAKDLSGDQRALFVEEEVGRIFCSEACIAAHFAPEIERLEKEYMRRLTPRDLNSDEREALDHLRWITLQEPDEVWREKTLSGDFRYTMISEFQPGDKRVWSVCICLFLRGEPSFLFIAFPTKNAAMVNHYRRGERVEWTKPERAATEQSEGHENEDAELADGADAEPTDRLADPWTEEETLRAQLVQERDESDIPAEEYALYQDCLQEALDAPDEVWSLDLGAEQDSEVDEASAASGSGEERDRDTDRNTRLYHFIKHYSDRGFWYVVIARETDDEDEIELLDAFPTRDANLVERHRRGSAEAGPAEVNKPGQRVIH
jgi:hypothetical protein